MIGFVEVSGNSKTGPIPVSRTVRASCPSGCPFNNVCYPNYGPGSWHWKRLEEKGGMGWDEFLANIRRLWKGQLWRHNEAGDLPHNNGTINRTMMRQLVAANKGKQGFTYTHHVISRANLETLRIANRGGFTVNASCEAVEQVDAVRKLGLPAVLVVGSELPKGSSTPDGHPLRRCPAETSNITCSRCGICARSDRQSVIYFTVHGPGTKRMTQRLAFINAATTAIRLRMQAARSEAELVESLVEFHNAGKAAA
jgi:hypothetical protein